MHSSIILTVFAAAATLTAAAPAVNSKRDDTVCAPGTGFFQSCSNGFRGCCTTDACSAGYCPDVKAAPKATPTPVVIPEGHDWHSEKTESKSNTNADPTVCAPGTGFFQSCSNGFRGCCKSDACSVGYCPDVKAAAEPVKRDETVCPPGTGFFQSCSNGFRGCCKSDACSLGYCPDVSTTVAPPVKRQDPTVCAPGTGFFQSCSNGFRGCCKADACSLGYCPDVETAPKAAQTPAAVPENHEWHSEKTKSKTSTNTDPTVCAPGTGFFQSCSNGFRGCCKSDACSLGYCPDLAVRSEKPDPTVCAPGTGFFQSCSNGFRGCCKSDACTIGYCPDVKTFETVTKAAPQTTQTPAATPENHEWHSEKTESKTGANADPTICAPGTGFFQSCSNGFRGCCKQDACTIGFCPSN
ncbi:hypothetical protein CCHL11_08573 [Colletotrichum chlorophyti]|uniref:Uncharacterized protein n=1 Tax=Colletotrichum chlorophyti TaxID=708187 RepID=A0A1Q8RAL3_9PEZI|nr:hypothetical protein CCHL11_08573 [Colletotrichum chlorophyti]